MMLVLVSSPFAAIGAGLKRQHVEYAKRALSDSLKRGEAPIVPHLLYPQVLNDDHRADRACAMACCLTWARKVDLVALYCDLGLSEGMRAEEAAAKAAGVRVEHRALFNEVSHE